MNPVDGQHSWVLDNGIRCRLEQAQQHKRSTELAILELLRAYQQQTGLAPSAIHLSTVATMGGADIADLRLVVVL